MHFLIPLKLVILGKKHRWPINGLVETRFLLVYENYETLGPDSVKFNSFLGTFGSRANILSPSKFDWREVTQSAKDDAWNDMLICTNMKLFIIKMCLGEITVFNHTLDVY